MARFVPHTAPSAMPSRTYAPSGSLPKSNWARKSALLSPLLRLGRAVELAPRLRRHRCSLKSSTFRWSSSSGIESGCSQELSLAPNHGPLRMQHDDDGTGSGSISLNRTQRSIRPKAHPAEQHADEVSGCRRSPERKAHREAFTGEYAITAESLIGLLPDAVLRDVDVDDVCRQQVFLANLLTSPYVRLQ